MAEYQWHLQKYAGTRTRHTCPSCGQKHCFTRYVNDADEYLHEAVGKCDHVSSCGYHKTPGEYYKENPDQRTDWKPSVEKKDTPQLGTMYLPFHYVKDSHSNASVLMQYLINDTKLNLERLANFYHLYMIGATRAGWTIFWQVDENGKVRTGKAMRYKPDGHRDKDTSNGRGKGFSWMHNLVERLPDAEVNRERDHTEMRQCLFGLHLMKIYEASPVAIVESEKSALIMSCIDESMIWMACGGIMNLSTQMLMPLIHENRKIILFPDRDGVKDWEKVKIEINYKKLYINYFARDKATERDPLNADIADIMLRRLEEESDGYDDIAIQMKLNAVERKLRLIEPHEALRLLINKFNLEIIR